MALCNKRERESIVRRIRAPVVLSLYFIGALLRIGSEFNEGRVGLEILVISYQHIIIFLEREVYPPKGKGTPRFIPCRVRVDLGVLTFFSGYGFSST
ncbi:hypothetical protein PAECIP111802_04481 [Paenibacillus allorhizosphaerae]|uniref:Uncharacterized protein n=1 Tax=Paenibacillus allorhizosphaerae TaxID=2849866 RepID=A0ABM8VMG0_9BACL|nr:hypothetical protein PAECIP111802_04481 [Paenibacillus allorhizosphaerae]